MIDVDTRSCPSCGQTLPEDSSLKDPELQPKPGDISVCLYCAAVLSYQADLSFAKMPEPEIEKLDLETLGEVMRVRHGIRQLRALRRPA